MTKRITKRKRVGRYSDAIRNQAGIEYAICGSLAQVSKSTNIPKNTLSMWHTKGTWDELIEQVRSETTNEHISQYNRLTQKALKLAEQGIDNLEGQPLKANDIKALVVTGATSTDKSRLLQSLPTTIQGKDTNSNIISFLESIAKTYDEKQANVVAVQDKVSD